MSLSSCSNVVESFSTLLQEYEPFFNFTYFSNEQWVLSKLLYKHKHTLGRCPQYQQLQQHVRYLKRLNSIKLKLLQHDLIKKVKSWSSFSSSSSSSFTISHSLHQFNALVQSFQLDVESIPNLLHSWKSVILSTTLALRHQLSQTYFMSFSFVGIAILARLFHLLHQTLDSLVVFLKRFEKLALKLKRADSSSSTNSTLNENDSFQEKDDLVLTDLNFTITNSSSLLLPSSSLSNSSSSFISSSGCSTKVKTDKKQPNHQSNDLKSIKKTSTGQRNVKKKIHKPMESMDEMDVLFQTIIDD